MIDDKIIGGLKLKTKGSLKIKVIAVFSLLIIILILISSFQSTRTFAAASVNIPTSKIIFADNSNSVVLPLNGSANNENFCAFTKDDKDIFTKVAFQNISNGSNSVTMNSNGVTWTYGQKYEYYIAVISENESYINSFNGKIATPDVDGKAKLTSVDGENTYELQLQKIMIIYDRAPQITNVNGNPSDWTDKDVTLTVNVSDPDSVNNMKYSFNGGDWQTDNSQSFATNGNISIKIKDEFGREITANPINISKIDKTAPVITLVDIDESAKYYFLNTVKFNINLSESESGIDGTVNVTVDGASFPQVQKKGTGQYEVSFNYWGDKFNNDIKIEVKDKAGNISTKTLKNLIGDKIAPTASIVDSTISNEWKKDDSSFEFSASDGESFIDLSKCTADVQNGNVQYSKKEGTDNTYIAKVTANEGKKIDQKIKLAIKDATGNQVEVTTEKNIEIDDEKPVINNLTVTNKNNPTKKAVKAGDIVQVSFTLNDNGGSGCDNTQPVKIAINGSELKTAQFIDGKFVCEFLIGTDVTIDDDSVITVTKLECADKVGNSTNDDTQSYKSECKYYAGIVISNVEFKSNNSNSLLAKNDDKVYVSFSTNHKIIVNGMIIQDTNTGIGHWDISGVKNSQTNKFDYKGYLTVEDIKSFDNQAFKFSFTLTDDADNASVTIDEAYTGLNPVIYYAPLNDTIYDLGLLSDGVSQTSVKDQDTISLNLKSKHPVSVSDAKITNQDVTMSSNDNFVWTGTKKIDGIQLIDNSDIKFSVKITDAAGNTAVTKTQEDASKVKFYAPINIYDLQMTSSNKTNGIAKNGDTIKITFITTHPVILTQGQISDKNVTFQSEDGMNWNVDYTIANGDIVDNQYVSLNLKLDDTAGNSQAQADQNFEGIQKIKYYSPMKISDVVITSSNSNDGAKYAKNGDEITVSFKTNHDVTVSSSNIARSSCSLSKNDISGVTKQWRMTYRINNGDLTDLSTIPFEFKIDDIAGNDPIIQRNTDPNVSNSITYYSPITADTSISSNYKSADYAKNGDAITVSAKTNHNVNIVESLIFSRATTNSNENGRFLKMSYTIPQNENVLEQGIVPFRYTVTDLAGNVLAVNTSSIAGNRVTYDRTRPTVSMTPEFNGFTNKNISYTFTFTDDNLSGNDVSIRVNGAEQVSQNEKSTATGKTFRKTITLSSENEYEVVATLVDKAGNKCFQDKVVKVTIDKTAPQVSSTSIDMTKAISFKSGIKLSDFLNITDKYISEVVCTITDNQGTREYDPDTPITGDGKKTINIIVKDMSGNTSSMMTYDLYIDGNPPKPVIKSENSNIQLLSLDKKMIFKSRLKLLIGLDSFKNGDMGDIEKFTTLKLVDKNGNVVVDLMNEGIPLSDGEYSLDVQKFGEYSLEVEAVDSVGNSTGLMKYNFVLKDKTLYEKFVSNKSLFIGSIAGLTLVVISIVILIIKKKKRFYL